VRILLVVLRDQLYVVSRCGLLEMVLNLDQIVESEMLIRKIRYPLYSIYHQQTKKHDIDLE